MPQTRGIGKLFWHGIRLRPDSPRHHRHPTVEYEHPYRSADAHVFRLRRNSGVAIGWWGPAGDFDVEDAAYADHIMGAVQGREQTSNERFKRISEKITWIVTSGDEHLPDATRTIEAVE